MIDYPQRNSVYFSVDILIYEKTMNHVGAFMHIYGNCDEREEFIKWFIIVLVADLEEVVYNEMQGFCRQNNV